LNVLVFINLPSISKIVTCSTPIFSLLVILIIFLAGLGNKLNLLEMKSCVLNGTAFTAEITILSYLYTGIVAWLPIELLFFNKSDSIDFMLELNEHTVK